MPPLLMIIVALQHACKSWYSHLIEARGDITGIVSTLRGFLQEGFLAWLEVLSVTGAARDAVTTLENLIPWLQEVRFGPLSCISRYSRTPQIRWPGIISFSAMQDYFHSATTFFDLIDIATHIYHSALEISPISSIFRTFYYHQRPHPSSRVVIGTPNSWNPSTSISSTWSSCGHYVAAVTEEVMEILDALTLELVSALQSAKVTTRFRPGLAYSPDRRTLVGCSDTSIVIWDAQTGGVVNKIGCEFTGDGSELVWSLDGKRLVPFHHRCRKPISYIRTTSPPVQCCLLAHSSQNTNHTSGPTTNPFGSTMTTLNHKNWAIGTLEVGSALTRIDSLSCSLDSRFGTFSPTTHRISVSATRGRDGGGELLVLDVRNSEVLLRETGSCWRFSFSPDGSVFAAFSRHNLHI